MSHSDENNDYDDAFNQMTSGFTADPHPYGPNGTPQATPHKPGLTHRGKVILGTAGVLLAAGGFLVYQDHAENIAAQNAKQAEIALQQQRLDLERLKVTNKVDTEQAKQQKTESKQIQQKIDACVDANRDNSAYLQGTVDACRDQYATSNSSSPGMEEAASVTSSGDSGVGGGWLIGAAAIGVVAIGGAYRGRRRNQDNNGGYVVVPTHHQQ